MCSWSVSPLKQLHQVGSRPGITHGFCGVAQDAHYEQTTDHKRRTEMMLVLASQRPHQLKCPRLGVHGQQLTVLLGAGPLIAPSVMLSTPSGAASRNGDDRSQVKDIAAF